MSDTMIRVPAGGLTSEDVLSRFQEILGEILSLESTEALTPDARLRDDLQIDSLGMVDIVIGIEQAFDVKIGSDTNLFERIETVSDAVELVLELAAEKQ